jgi:hypothetical protein
MRVAALQEATSDPRILRAQLEFRESVQRVA